MTFLFPRFAQRRRRDIDGEGSQSGEVVKPFEDHTCHVLHLEGEVLQTMEISAEE